MISEFIKGDARRAFNVLKGGGIAVIPMDVGYTCAGGSRDALQKIFNTKKRSGPFKTAFKTRL